MRFRKGLLHHSLHIKLFPLYFLLQIKNAKCLEGINLNSPIDGAYKIFINNLAILLYMLTLLASFSMLKPMLDVVKDWECFYESRSTKTFEIFLYNRLDFALEGVE